MLKSKKGTKSLISIGESDVLLGTTQLVGNNIDQMIQDYNQKHHGAIVASATLIYFLHSFLATNTMY